MGSNNASSGGGSNRYEPPKKKNIVQKIFEASPTVKVVKAIAKNIKETKQKKDMQTALDYEGAAYKTKRGSTYVTNEGGGNDNNSNKVVQAPKVIGPTTAEVSQVASVPEVTTEEARTSANELILKKRRGRGRSLNMLKTSSQGLNNEGLTLSQKTLLG
jgi:hypothetical protein